MSEKTAVDCTSLVARVKEAFDYDEVTGLLIWRIPTSNRARVGARVGNLHNGYLATQFDGRRYMVHRLVWIFVYGRAPNGFLDHVNGLRSDNRICNLREASPRQNAWNVRPHFDNQFGAKGLNFHPGRKKPWQARICKDGRTRSLGYFSEKQDAEAAYGRAAAHLFGEFARVS